MRVVDFDHLVLNVADVERSLAFYTGPLGLAPMRVDEWRAGKLPFPSVRVNEHTILDLVSRPRGESAERSLRSEHATERSLRSEHATERSLRSEQSAERSLRSEQSNVDHFCLVVEPLDWQEVIDAGTFTVLEGPVGRSGARGDATSIYVADPDANTIELRWYPQDVRDGTV